MSFHQYRIAELYSNADGALQFVELATSVDFESFWAGQTISATQGAVTHAFTFPTDLPGTATANTTVLLATAGFAALGIVAPDFVLPDRFLFTDGGVLNFANADALVYAALPTDGTSSLARSGATQAATPRNFAGLTGTLPADRSGGTGTGTPGDDLLAAGTADRLVDGDAGHDVLLLGGPRADFTVHRDTAGFFAVTDARDGGTDTLRNVEALRFTDGDYALQAPPPAVAPDRGASPAFLFDPVYYLLANADLAATVDVGNAAQHYLASGAAQGRAPNAWFDAGFYGARWPDLAALALDDATLFMHLNLYGIWEGRSAAPRFEGFDGARYLAENPDVAAYVDANVDDFLGSRSNGAIAHWVIYGAAEQRVAHDLDGAAIDLGYAL